MRSVNHRETLVTYLRAETTREAAKTLGISVETLAARIKVLRQAGVKVPKKRGRGGRITPLEVAQLNSLVNKHAKEMAKL